MATTESPDKPGGSNATAAAALGGEPEPRSVEPGHDPDGVTAAAAPGGEPEARSAEPDHDPDSWLRGYSALLIAFIAALGAIITWRAEVAATNAAEATQQGVVVAINLGAEKTKDRALAMGAAADVARVQQLLDERDLLGEELSLTPAGAAKAQVRTEYSVAFWVAEWQLRNDWPDNSYLSNAASSPTYDISRNTSDLVAESRLPTNSAPYFAQANSAQDRRRRLLLLDIGLVIGLACATVAHQVARRGRLQVLCAAAGTAVFALGLIAFSIVGV